MTRQRALNHDLVRRATLLGVGVLLILAILVALLSR